MGSKFPPTAKEVGGKYSGKAVQNLKTCKYDLVWLQFPSCKIDISQFPHHSNAAQFLWYWNDTGVILKFQDVSYYWRSVRSYQPVHASVDNLDWGKCKYHGSTIQNNNDPGSFGSQGI